MKYSLYRIFSKKIFSKFVACFKTGQGMNTKSVDERILAVQTKE
jgi:hypothetical protein